MRAQEIMTTCLAALLTAAATVVVFIASLTYLQAPTYSLWKLSLLASEIPAWSIGTSLLLFLAASITCLRTKKHKAARVLSGIAALALGAATMLFCVPVGVTLAQAARLNIPLDFVGTLAGRTFNEPPICRKDIVFFQGAEGPLKLDLYSPYLPKAADQRLPVVIVIHGGGWNHGGKSDFEKIDRWLAGRGLIVLDVEYRLANGKIRFPSQVDDVHQVLDWLHTNADEIKADASRVCLLGRSAGAQIALCEAYRHANEVKAVVSFYGPTDLVWGYHNTIQPDILNATLLLENYLGGSPQTAAETYAAASPLDLAAKNSPATLLLHGDSDQIVSCRHSTMLADKLNSLGVPNKLVLLEFADHGFDAIPNGLHSQMAMQEVEQFLKKHLQ